MLISIYAPTYTPVLTTRQPMLPPRPGLPRQPPMVTLPCVFCHASNSSGRAPRDCPIGQDYVRSGKLIFDRGFYHWPNGVRVQGHPWGLKASVDIALQSQARAPAVQEGTAAYYRVEPVGEIEEERESPEVTLEEAKEAYL